MTSLGQARAILALHGAGSDDRFARRVFSPLAEAAGVPLVAPFDPSRSVLDTFGEAIAQCCQRYGNIIVAGTSLGAVCAAKYVAAHPQAPISALGAVLPPWTERAAGSPAALAASASAQMLRADGLNTTLESVVDSSPVWLGAELSRAWSRYSLDQLVQAFSMVQSVVGVDSQQLASLQLPVAIVGCGGDAIHPASVALQWHAAVAHSSFEELSLGEFGEFPARAGELLQRALLV